MRRSTLIGAAVVLFAAPGLAQPAPAQAPGPAGGAPGGAPSGAAGESRVATRDFMRRVQMSDSFENASSRLARQQAGAEVVRNFAADMVRDHIRTTQALSELLPQSGPGAPPRAADPRAGGNATARAAQSDETMPRPDPDPEGMDPEHQQAVQRLSLLRGAEFDRACMQAQVHAQRQAVDLFTAYAQSGDQEALKLWAGRTLPVLQQHLQPAQQLPQGR